MTGAAVFESLGGVSGCRKLAAHFYARVARDPLLKPLFPAHMKCPIEEFSAFLIQFLGGPPDHSQRRWWLSLHESHARFRFGQPERAAWLAAMGETLDDFETDEAARAALKALFESSSAYLTRQPATDSGELAAAWNSQLALDAAVEAVEKGDTAAACSLARECTRNVLPGLLARMIRSVNPGLDAFVMAEIRREPVLLAEYYAGRMLLHAAAGSGNLSMAVFLLEAGADPDTRDSGGHTPLYSVANEGSGADGAQIVRALVRAGAHVEAADGVQKTTPLHMAARRGNVAVAEALLECGADPRARDRKGETPAHRARNCRKPELAELLMRAVRS